MSVADLFATSERQMIGDLRDDECAVLEAGAADIVPADGIRSKLQLVQSESRPLIVKLGFDPTAPDLHLGHAVVLRKLRQFQRLGHRIVIIIGEFTASIGDPTGKNEARPPLSREAITENAQTYLNQLGLVLDVARIEVRSNAEWFDAITLRGMIDLMAQHTLAQIMAREDFTTRFREGSPISLHELVYPILQGYDSYVINADVELGGHDQLLNCLVGRHMQAAKGRPAQTVLCMPLLRGVDGTAKMSKSQGNYVGLTEPPDDMYGKIMAISDELLPEYVALTMAAPVTARELQQALLAGTQSPMAAKKAVAFDVVRQFHGDAAAQSAADTFYRKIQRKVLDDEDYVRVPLATIGAAGAPVSLVDIGAAITRKSKSEIRRLIASGGVSVNGDQTTDVAFVFKPLVPGTRLRFGKRAYYEIAGDGSD
jgi:tyrosyl-tRNA synthetase